MKISYNKINMSDSEAIYNLGKLHFDWVYEKVSWFQRTVDWHIKNFPELCYQAKYKNKIIGFCFGFIEGDIGYISWILVDEDYRRQGVAKNMLNLVIPELKDKSKFIASHVRRNNDSFNLFNKLGFNEIEQVKTEMVLKC
jgi:ribosomal protein S18 acetylase RimI-like enzyme